MSNIHKMISGALVMGVAVFLLAASGPTITGEEAKTLVKQGALLLDVRTTGEFAAGHVEGAVNVPVGELEAKVGTLPAKKDQAIVVYCQSGRRSAAARTTLQRAGFTKVVDLGAMSNWK